MAHRLPPAYPPGDDRHHPAIPTDAQQYGDEPRGYSPAPYVPASGIGSGAILKEYLGIARRGWWMLLIGSILGGAFAYYHVKQQRPRYRAEAVIRIKDPAEHTGGAAGISSFVRPGFSQLQTQIQLLQSRSVAEAVVDSLGLQVHIASRGLARDMLLEPVVGDHDAGSDTVHLRFLEDGVEARSAGTSLTAAYGERFSVGDVTVGIRERPVTDSATLVVVPRRQAISGLQSVQVAPRAGTGIIDLSYTAFDPKVAQEVVNAAADAFQTMNTLAAREQARRGRRFLEDQLARTDSLLTVAQLELSDFRRREEILSTANQFSSEQAAVSELDLRIQELRTDRQLLQQVVGTLRDQWRAESAVSLRARITSIGVVGNPVVDQLFSTLLAQETELETKTTGQYASALSNPDVQQLGSLMAYTRTKLADAIVSQIQGLDVRLAALEDLQYEKRGELRRLPVMEIEEMRLAQRVESARQMADQLRGELQRAMIAEVVETGPVEIVDRALVPARPIPGGHDKIIMLGLLAGLFLGGGVAFLREILNTSIRRKEELETVLQVPGLAVIPRIENGTARDRRLGLPVAGRATNGNAGVVRRNQGDKLVTVREARSAGAEAYRTLRTSLLFSQAVQTLRTVVITSAGPGEGKTTISANLATTFAQQGLRVLLIDCDLRRSQVHNLFGLRHKPGLTELLVKQAAPDDVIHNTEVDGLFVLTAGTLPPNPSELLGGKPLRQLFSRFAESFDIVLVDTPPLLAAADASILGSWTDGVVMVVRAGYTERAAAEYAVEQLSKVGARILGAVLNDPDGKVPQYSGGYYYYHSYYGADA